MPCDSGGWSPSYSQDNAREMKKKLDKVTRVACDMAKVLRAHFPIAFKPNKGVDSNLRQETIKWVKRHEAVDRKRLLREKKATRRDKLISRAKSKLTVAEYNALTRRG